MYLEEREIKLGEKKKYTIQVKAHYEIPVWMVYGKYLGKTLVITAGVHGCEYVGVQAAKKLFKTLDPNRLSGTVIILPLMNPEGFYNGSKQIMPEDGKNLNRSFPGNPEGSISEQVAYFIETEIYPNADFIIDLHGGDINEAMTPLVFFPVEADESVKEKVRLAAMHMPVPYRIRSISKNGLYSYGVQKGVPGLLLEIGGMGRWTDQEVDLCIDCVQGVMGYLEIGDKKEINHHQQESTLTIYEESDVAGFWYPNVHAGTKVQLDDVLGEIRDINDNILRIYRASFDGVVLYYTKTLGVREGDPLVAYGRF